MVEKSGPTPGAPALEMRLRVPADGSLRAIASELATKIAEHLGTNAPDARSLGATIDEVASRLGELRRPEAHDITFSFRELDGELVIEARRNSESSEVRHPLPA